METYPLMGQLHSIATAPLKLLPPHNTKLAKCILSKFFRIFSFSNNLLLKTCFSSYMCSSIEGGITPFVIRNFLQLAHFKLVIVDFVVVIKFWSYLINFIGIRVIQSALAQYGITLFF